MPPFMGGGEMIEVVGLQTSTFAPPPNRFEPGTPGIAEAIAFGAAVDYLGDIGMDAVHGFERELGGLLYQEVSYETPKLRARVFLNCLLKGSHAVHPAARTYVQSVVHVFVKASKERHLCMSERARQPL